MTAEIYNLEKVLLAKYTFSILLYRVAVTEVSIQIFETHSCEQIFMGCTKSQGHSDFALVWESLIICHPLVLGTAKLKQKQTPTLRDQVFTGNKA